MDCDEFEWEEAAAEANLVRHEVGFRDACDVFEDAFALALHDPGHPGEARFRITGCVRDELLTVAYDERGALIRILSARRATSYERRIYHQG